MVFDNPSGNVDGEDISPSSVTTDDLRNTISDAKAQTAWDGLVVPVAPGLGMADAINPANTTTPVQDAIDAVATTPGGVVLLPPTNVDEVGPITAKTGVSIKGWNGLLGGTGGFTPVSEITITNADTAAGIELGDVNGFRLEDFTLSGQGPTGSGATSALNNPSGASAGPRDWGFDNLTIRNWRGMAINIQTGCYQMDSGTIRVASLDAGNQTAVFNFQNPGPDNRIREITAYPYSTATSSDNLLLSHQSQELQVDWMNVGRATGQLISQGGSALVVGGVNYEPTVSNSTTFALVELRNGDAFIDSINLNNSGGAVDVSFLFNQLTQFPNHELTKPRNGSNLNNKPLRINADIQDPILYSGTVGDVNNVTGAATTAPVVCLGDITKKVSDGLGYDGGTNDSQL